MSARVRYDPIRYNTTFASRRAPVHTAAVSESVAGHASGIASQTDENPRERDGEDGEIPRTLTDDVSLVASAADAQLHAAAGGAGMRDSGGERRHRAPRPLPLVAARQPDGLRDAQPA